MDSKPILAQYDQSLFMDERERQTTRFWCKTGMMSSRCIRRQTTLLEDDHDWITLLKAAADDGELRRKIEVVPWDWGSDLVCFSSKVVIFVLTAAL